MSKPPIHIRSQDWSRIEAILKRMLPEGIKVWAYGSRVHGGASESSDLDLALVYNNGDALSPALIRAIKSCLSESNVPIIVEIHNKASLPASFQRKIESEAILLFEQSAVRQS
jgi:uncharacterized protein